MDKRTIGEKFGDKKLVGKKLPENKLYKDVKSNLDTGKSNKDAFIVSDQFVAKKKGELFKRLKGSTIVKLIDENKNSESIYNIAENPENILKNNLSNNITNNNMGFSTSGNRPNNNFYSNQVNDNESVYSGKTDKTSLTNVTNKTGFTAITYATQMLGNLSDISFIILDLRDKDDYDRFHIKESISYPASNICRDKFPIEMVNLKNKDSKMIILYHNDERHSIPHAQLIIQKGYDNIYLLSGGIEDFVKEFPEKCEGTEVEGFIKMKMQDEIMKKESYLKGTKGKVVKNTTTGMGNRSNSFDVRKKMENMKIGKDYVTGKVTDKK